VKTLLTGHDGYIGTVMVGVLTRAGHQVTGLDTFLYEDCRFGNQPAGVPSIRKDLRDVVPADLAGYDAVIHLAALSNDPLGTLDERCTREINHLGSVRLARAAKAAGVPRFLFASSCSLYGAAGDALLDETAAFNPITAYGRSKVLVEQDVSVLADDRFSPTFFRNATAYGASPRLRADVVVNNLVGVAYLTGQVLIESDGTPWRPLVHVEDISQAFRAALEAPREAVHNQAFNIGSSSENYQIRELADMVTDVVPGCGVRYREGGGPDPRCYRVNCDKVMRALPGFRTQWTVRRGIEQLYDAFRTNGLTADAFASYFRLPRVQAHLEAGRLDRDLRWRVAAAAATPARVEV
jgi:nucleoside-diphosphate-sugar epimerase